VRADCKDTRQLTWARSGEEQREVGKRRRQAALEWDAGFHELVGYFLTS